jgi:hypothetical protein
MGENFIDSGSSTPEFIFKYTDQSLQGQAYSNINSCRRYTLQTSSPEPSLRGREPIIRKLLRMIFVVLFLGKHESGIKN